MESFGKICPRCRIYFVGRRANERLCPWCTEIEAGIKQPELYSRVGDVETLEL